MRKIMIEFPLLYLAIEWSR